MSKLRLAWLAIPLCLLCSIPSSPGPSVVHEISVPVALRYEEPCVTIEVERVPVSRGEVTRTKRLSVPLSAELQEYTYKLCEEYDIVDHFDLVIAVMAHESRFDAAAVSSTNDYGIMQINKGNHTWLSRELGIVDFLDPKQNILAGSYMLSDYLHKYETVEQALMAYNMGEPRAKLRWADGIYRSTYSDAVLDQLKRILKGEYI